MGARQLPTFPNQQLFPRLLEPCAVLSGHERLLPTAHGKGTITSNSDGETIFEGGFGACPRLSAQDIEAAQLAAKEKLKSCLISR